VIDEEGSPMGTQGKRPPMVTPSEEYLMVPVGTRGSDVSLVTGRDSVVISIPPGSGSS
jgi:hypothetical protein